METLHYVLDHDSGEPQQPTRGHDGDAGMDLYCSRTQVIQPSAFCDVHTDLSIAMPRGYFARICGRSSSIRRGLLVVEGVIDNGYRGELYSGVYNMTDNSITVHVGERLAQLILHRIHREIHWSRVSHLSSTDRGSSGFGSTGK
jgi:dUTP pyrophosphatase